MSSAGVDDPMFASNTASTIGWLTMGEAIWSADPRQFDRFPARHFAQFFKNHGFLNVRDQPLWLTIQGGSRRYIEPITRPFKDNLRLSCPVRFLRRNSDHVEVTACAETQGPTGVEMEALTAASVALLTVYDMCKALSHDIRIEGTRLLEKRGGKSDFGLR